MKKKLIALLLASMMVAGLAAAVVVRITAVPHRLREKPAPAKKTLL